jgi:hypothetical protein
MKRVFLFSTILIIILIASCARYKQLALSQEMLMQNEEFVKHLNGMTYYVHADEKIIKVNNINISDTVFFGKIENIISDKEEMKNIISPPSDKQKKHKYDINIYTNKSFDNLLASANNYSVYTDSIITLNANEIEKIDGYTLDKKKTVAASALLIIIIIVVAILLIWGIIALMTSAAKAGSNASAESSGASSGASSAGSGTSSGASSGGSNASSAGSGASSGASSGCYIATMVYGSYDAPEVMVLRKFRDNKLYQSFLGKKFIQFYYKYSPLLVEKLKDYKTINLIIKKILDNVVNYLDK